MSVENIMSKNVVTVELDDTLVAVREIFENVGFHHLMVVEDNKLYGVISDRDYYKAVSPNLGTLAETRKDRQTLLQKAHQIMTRHPIVLQKSASIKDAIDLFNEQPISCIPIIDEDNTPIGVVSWRDILKLLGSKKL